METEASSLMTSLEAKRGTVSVWMTNLCWLALPVLLRTFLRHGRFTLRFAAASRSGPALAWLLRAVGILDSKAQRVEFTYHGLRVDDPKSLRLLAQAVIPNEFTSRFFNAYERLLGEVAYPDPRVSRDRILTNLRKSVAETTHQLMAFVEFARYRHRIEGISTGHLVILSPLAVLANWISPEWAGRDVEFDCPWSRHHSLLLRVCRAVLRFMINAVRRRRPQQSVPASVAVTATFGLDASARFNDLFWWWDSGIPAERVVLCFDWADVPAKREVVAQAERLGFRCVVLNRHAVGDSPHLLWRPAPGLAVSIKRLWRELMTFGWGISRRKVGCWTACRMLDMLHFSGELEDFILEFNVRGLFHYQDAAMDYHSVACEAAGAARIGYQWSYYPWPEVSVARIHQVYFAWGPYYVPMLEATGSCVDHVLLAGCIVNTADHGEGNGQGVMQHRTAVMAHGASRVLALFDTSLPCEGFYEFFLRRVIEDPRWGLLIKPKKDYLPWKHQMLPELKALYEQAQATGRVRLLDRWLTPAEAAAAADFAVGVDINSATIVAALAGHRAIHLDYIRLHVSPFSEWAYFHRAGPDRLVFNNPNKLWEKLNSYFDEPGSEAALGLGDDLLLREFDSFRDTRAGQRIGEYIRWYLEGLDRGLDSNLALRQADRCYADRWGAEMVIGSSLGANASARHGNGSTILSGSGILPDNVCPRRG